jgi:N-acetylneuraminic acid mutarotase
MTSALKLLPVAASCVAIALLSATCQVSAAAGIGGTTSLASTTVNAGEQRLCLISRGDPRCKYVVIAAAGAGGTISPAITTVNAGSTTMLTVTARSGYVIRGVTGCGGTLSGNTYTTGAINANCVVAASFNAHNIAQYAVTATAGTGGALSPSSATVNAGSTTTFTVTPKSGYIISGVTGCGGSLSNNTYTTGAISGNCTVTATFAAAFTWVNGPTTGLENGIYGTKGSPTASTVPGGRNSSAAWTDASGNLWIFGGYGIDYGSTGNPGQLNDLWEYSPSSGEWTWVAGSNIANTAGVYGTKGAPASTNMPGARQNAVTWTDTSGNVWLFGGTGYDSGGSGLLNDLWMYSPSSGQWTWVGGSSTALAAGVYGNPGTPASTNVPGARFAAVGWQDAHGNLWLFGGWGFDSAGMQGVLNDLWEYSPSSGEWTWVSGSNTVNASGDYGSLGVAASTNVPRARSDAVSWTDAAGNLWLFGGMGTDSAGAANLNDLWMFSPVSGGWIWVGGSNAAHAGGVYGTQGVAAAANVPGARWDATGWTDAAGNLWLFGGWGSDSNGTVGSLNDLWEYSSSSGEWVWMQGSSTANAFETPGTKGVAALTNIPGARQQVTSVKDASGNVWLFGGFGYGFINGAGELNDLWMYPTQ